MPCLTDLLESTFATFGHLARQGKLTRETVSHEFRSTYIMDRDEFAVFMWQYITENQCIEMLPAFFDFADPVYVSDVMRDAEDVDEYGLLYTAMRKQYDRECPHVE